MREELLGLRPRQGGPTSKIHAFPAFPNSAGSRADPQRAQGRRTHQSTRCAELNDRFGPMIQAIVEAHVRQREAKGPGSQSA